MSTSSSRVEANNPKRPVAVTTPTEKKRTFLADANFSERNFPLAAAHSSLSARLSTQLWVEENLADARMARVRERERPRDTIRTRRERTTRGERGELSPPFPSGPFFKPSSAVTRAISPSLLPLLLRLSLNQTSDERASEPAAPQPLITAEKKEEGEEESAPEGNEEASS